MLLNQLKDNFVNQLTPQYGANEAQQFFYMLAEAYLGYNKIEVTLEAKKEIDNFQEQKIKKAIQRLLKSEPIQYIIGSAYFYGNDFKVTEHTLIPRPETEELVDWIIADCKGKSISILDIGTGSGCIAISLAKNLPLAKVSAVDISTKALQVAKQNNTNLLAEVNFIEQNILQTEQFSEKYDIVVSNPPYVRDLEKGLMSANVLEYEPDLALFVSDTNPLLFYEKITSLFLAKAKPTAMLYFEINEYLAKELSELLYKLGFGTIEVKQDFRGKDRMLKAMV